MIFVQRVVSCKEEIYQKNSFRNEIQMEKGKLYGMLMLVLTQTQRTYSSYGHFVDDTQCV
jgi:hypothetical protein